MPSFLEKEQLHAIQPFIADANSILGTFQTKVEYWRQGAAAVKGAYQKFLNLDLTHNDNQTRLDEFMKTAKTQLQQVSQTDLSVGDNQQMAMSIFEPIVKDREIMGDNAITKFFKEQYAIGESYKNKDGGKYYNSNNQNWMLKQLADFSTDDARNWQTHWNMRDGYTPYVDLSAKWTEFVKNYKPPLFSKAAGTDEKGNLLPLITTEGFKGLPDASDRVADMRRAFYSTLDEKDKKQLMINGMMRFGNDDSALAKGYLNQSASDVSMLQGEQKLLKEQLKGIQDPVLRKYQEDRIKASETESEQILSQMADVQNGNMSYIKQNRRSLAETLYTGMYVKSLAEGNVYNGFEHKIEVANNPAWGTKYTVDAENQRSAARLRYDYYNANLEHIDRADKNRIDAVKEGWELNPDGTINFGLVPTSSLQKTNPPLPADVNNTVNGIDYMYGIDKTLAEDDKLARENIKNFLIGKNGSADNVTDESIDAFIQEQRIIYDMISGELAKPEGQRDLKIMAKRVDPEYLQYRSRTQANEVTRKSNAESRTRFENRLKEIPQLAGALKNKSVQVSDGTVTPANMIIGFLNNTNEIKMIPGERPRIEYIKVNGKTYQGLDASKLYNTYMSTQNFYNDGIANNKEAAAKLKDISTQYISQRPWFTTTNEKSMRVKNAKNYVSGLFGLDAKDIQIPSFTEDNQFIVGFNNTAEIQKLLKDKNFENVITPGGAFTVKKIGDGEGADAKYLITTTDYKPFLREAPLRTNVYLGNRTKNALDQGMTTSGDLELNGNGLNFRFEVINSQDDVTPNKYRVWYTPKGASTSIQLKTLTGDSEFNDFNSAWEYANLRSSQGSTIAEQVKNFNNYLQQIGY